MNRVGYILGSDERQEEAGARPDSARWLFRLRNVACTFCGKGGVRVEELDITKGCATAIMGRSGSGKSTLLHLLGGMLAPEPAPPGTQFGFALSDAGGREHDLSDPRGWPRLRRHIGFVFQDPVLFRDASCRTNLATSLAAAGLPIDNPKIESLWKRLGLELPKLDQPARTLSGGMQQRVAVARALVRDPDVIFADEPTASLDPASGEAVMRLLEEWQQGGPGRSLLLITHDIDLATEWADEFVVLALPAGDSADGSTGRLSRAGRWPSSAVPAVRAWAEETASPSRQNESFEAAQRSKGALQ